MLEELVRHAKEHVKRLHDEPGGTELLMGTTRQLLRDPKYRAATRDKVLTNDEFNYLVLFELTREEVYRPDTEGIIERIWEEFARRVSAAPQDAEDAWGTLENKVTNHYNTMQLHFGRYAGAFGESEQ